MEYLESSQEEIKYKKSLLYKPGSKKEVLIRKKRCKCSKVVQIMKGGILCLWSHNWKKEK